MATALLIVAVLGQEQRRLEVMIVEVEAQKDTEVSRDAGGSLEDLREQQHKLAADIARLEEHDASVGELQPAAKH